MRHPPYLDRALHVEGPPPHHVHLGYWEVPEGAGTSLDELRAAQERLTGRALGLLDARDGQSILDVGCGLGGALASLDGRIEHARLVGLGNDPRQLAVAGRFGTRADNALEWVEADACELPFGDATFDRVLCIEAMFHFASRRAFFAEAGRVLRPGGRLVVTDLVATSSEAGAPTDAAVEQTILAGAGPWPDLWGSDADYAGLAEQAGLAVETLHDITRQTLPSYACFGVAGPRDPRAPLDPVQESTRMLGRLQAEGRLGVLLASFDAGSAAC